MKPSKLYTADGYDGPALSIHGIAARAACSYVNAFERVRDGKPVAGHVWTLTGEAEWVPARPGTPAGKQAARDHGRPIKLMESDDFPGRTFTQDEVRAMGQLKPKTPLQPYVRRRTPIGGHVWRFAGIVTRSPGQDNVAPPPRTCAWEKARAVAPVMAAAPETRGHVWAAESELMPINGSRIQAADLPSGVKL